MKDVKNIFKSQLFISLVWAVLGFSLLVQQVSATPIPMNSVEVSTSDNEDADQQEEVAIITQAAINSVVGVHLTQELHQIMEINFESKNDPRPTAEVTLFEAGHFRALFRMVISPNAP